MTARIVVLLLAAWLCQATIPEWLDRYDVEWTAPSRDSSGSMPLGNGDISLNLWVEQGGDVLFYVGKTDAWSENGRLLKLGRVRLALSPNPFVKDAPFRQRLNLRQGEIVIKASPENSETSVTVRVDANSPVVYMDINSQRALDLRVSLELWRTKQRVLGAGEVDSAYGMEGGPDPVVAYPDTVQPGQKQRIVWFHRNPVSIWPLTLKHQGLESITGQLSDPLANRTFGGLITGERLQNQGDTTLKSQAPQRRHRVAIHLMTRQTATPEEWLELLETQARRVESQDQRRARSEHLQWWDKFWDRSWIRATGSPEADTASRGYILQRFLNAAAGRGAYPIKFNGSIFNVDGREPKETFDADYRRWGGPYWFQNTRLAYWPMLAAGDLDLMAPLFRMYVEALPLARERTKVYFGHEGAFFPETMYFWGTYANSNYGWNRTGKPVSWVQNTYIRYYWQGGLELITMMLDYFAYTKDDSFLKTSLLPFADSIVTFYDQHYSRGPSGKILFQPAAALETWHEAVNPMPEIAGLRTVLPRLLALPRDLINTGQRRDWERLLSELPPLPTVEVAGQPVLAAAEQLIGPIKNMENPELYAVFPYRLYGVGKPDLELARRTFEKRRKKATGGWFPDAILAAHLGLADIAAKYTVENFSKHHAGSRFPAFWGPNYDWIPDQDHGCVAMMALQAMVLQADGSKILLLPSWPKQWNAEFKLHAPENTTVEGVYRSGKLERLSVKPARRTADVVVQ